MSDQPELVSICLCERLLQDVFRRDAVSLVNVHNTVASQGFPTLIPVIYAFAQLRPSPKPFSYQFKFTDSQNNVLSASHPGMVEALFNKNALHKVIGAFTGLVLPAADTYTVSLEIEGKLVGSIPFEVSLAQVEELTQAQAEELAAAQA